MEPLLLKITEQQAEDLYRLLHHLDNQTPFADLYLQLQKHFFTKLTIQELQVLLDGPS